MDFMQKPGSGWEVQRKWRVGIKILLVSGIMTGARKFLTSDLFLCFDQMLMNVRV